MTNPDQNKLGTQSPIQDLNFNEVDLVGGGVRNNPDGGGASNVTRGVTLAAIGTIAVGIGLAVPTGGASLVAVGGFLTAGGWFVASGG
ncbi:hypothetical protein [Alteriqipengyuania lutimaris]|uniref:Bacteriocin n=1 Tax=Alteriqipengyuania lutimaris TaxID=1538146 RepID=A0A395LST4_9SPHN|nr:hypothetical protein [Alteriqipengyuania lutimaris]MBB3033363.1 hypothetical protein [Alteriqipengyuania lutimaris]RDS77610.1 hypothetical protein DL238_08330 [Alteriqipengyuania lutimaris]